MKSLKKGFGQQVKMLRKSKNYTQEVFAEMIDLSPRQLIRIENGENFPSAETLGKLCLTLNVHPQKLFDFAWDPSEVHFLNKSYNLVSLKVIKSKNEVSIENISKIKTSQLNELKHASLDNYENKISNFSQKYSILTSVEVYKNAVMTAIKLFYPNGKIETILTESDIRKREILNKLIEKLNKFSLDEEKMNYIRLAVESLEDKDSLYKLGCLIQGMKLVL